MKIILNHEIELNPILITSQHRIFQGANRDVLSFVFSESVGLDELDNLFNASNCEHIAIIDDNGESNSIYTEYTLRVELKREPTYITTENSEAVYENRVIVSMAQRTFQESQLLSLRDTVDLLVIDALEG